MRGVLIAVGFVVAVEIVGLAVLVGLHVLMSTPDCWVVPTSGLADTHISDDELVLLCGPDDEFDWACELELAFNGPCAPEPTRLS